MGIGERSTIIIGMICLLIIGPATFVEAQPRAVELMQDLKKTPTQKHGRIYYRIMKDTSVLDHAGLRRELVKIAREEWYGRYVKGNIFHRVNTVKLNEPGKPIDFEEINGSRLYGAFQGVINAMGGREFLEATLWVLPHAPAAGRRSNTFQMQKKLIEHDPRALRMWLKRVEYEDKNPKQRKNNEIGFNREDYRLISSDIRLTRPMYELIRRNQVELKRGMKKRLKNFLWNTIQDEKLAGIKTFSVALLLDAGISENEIRNKMKNQGYNTDEPPGGGPTTFITPKQLNKAAFNRAKLWRKEYPKWPIEEEESGSDKSNPGKGQQ